MLKKIANVSSSRDLGGNSLVTLGFYGKLIKEKNSIRILFSLKKCLVVITEEQFIYTILYSTVFR